MKRRIVVFASFIAVFLPLIATAEPDSEVSKAAFTWDQVVSHLSRGLDDGGANLKLAVSQLEKAQNLHDERMELKAKLRSGESNDPGTATLRSEINRLAALEYSLVFEGKACVQKRIEQAKASGSTPYKNDLQVASLSGAAERSALEILEGVPDQEEGMPLLQQNFERHFGGKWNPVDSVAAQRFRSMTRLEGESYLARLLISQLKAERGQITPVGEFGQKVFAVLALGQVSDGYQAVVPHLRKVSSLFSGEKHRPVHVISQQPPTH